MQVEYGDRRTDTRRVSSGRLILTRSGRPQWPRSRRFRSIHRWRGWRCGRRPKWMSSRSITTVWTACESLVGIAGRRVLHSASLSRFVDRPGLYLRADAAEIVGQDGLRCGWRGSSWQIALKLPLQSWISRSARARHCRSYTYGYRGFYVDACRAVDFLHSRTEVDPDRIGVHGSSQGGALTLTTAALRNDAITCGAAGAPYLVGFMDSVSLTHSYPYEESMNTCESFPTKRRQCGRRLPILTESISRR